ncbi:hypothetical protein ITP53_17300, partial [Nonomuraea sp. K274]
MDWPNCPDCGAALSAVVDACPECRLLLHGPAADAYLAVAVTLARVEEHRAELVRRRDEALAGMRRAGTALTTAPATDATRARDAVSVGGSVTDSVGGLVAEAGGTRPVADTGPVESDGPIARVRRGRRTGRDLSHRAVQNLLLLLGGLLLSIAAVVFTLVSWQVPTLRALILSVFTLGVLAAPWLLVRRRLVATAETVALIGLVLIPLDGVAIAQIFDSAGPSTDPELNPMWGWSLSAAALAVAWAAYSWAAPLRLPAAVAIVLAQAPLPLAGLALLGGSPSGFSWMAAGLLATAAFDLALWQAARRARAAIEYVTTAVAGALAWVLGTSLTALLAVSEADADHLGSVPLVSPFVVAGLLAAASVIAMWWAGSTRAPAARLLIAACSGLAAIGAVCAVPASVVPVSWQAAVFAVTACLLLAATLKLPVRLRDGLRTGGVLTLAAAASWKAPGVAEVAFAPLSWLADIWRDVTGPASGLLSPAVVPWGDTAATPVVMSAVAAGLALVPRGAPGELWTGPLRRTLCLVFASLAVLTTPVATGMPYEVALAVLVALACALLLGRPRTAPHPGTAPRPDTVPSPSENAPSSPENARPLRADLLTRVG